MATPPFMSDEEWARRMRKIRPLPPLPPVPPLPHVAPMITSSAAHMPDPRALYATLTSSYCGGHLLSSTGHDLHGAGNYSQMINSQAYNSQQQAIYQQEILMQQMALQNVSIPEAASHVRVIMQHSALTEASAMRPIVTETSADLDTVTELTSDMVDNYGASEMKRSAVLSDKLLSIISQDNGGEFSEKLNDLVLVAKGLDPTEAAGQRSIWRRFLNFLGIKAETAAAQYKMLDAQISTLAGELGTHSGRQVSRKKDLESLYQENTGSYVEIETLVKKGRVFLSKATIAPIAEVKSGMEAQQIADRQALGQRLEKRITDLDVAMTLMLQTAPEIRIMQANAQALIDKFTTLVNLTIPAWKKQFALHVLQLEQRRSAIVADSVDDATNDAFVKNASMLHDNTLQVAKSGQRQIMDMSTVEHVQGEILRTVADVRQLNMDASASRAQIAGKLEHIRDDLVKSVAGRLTVPQLEEVSKKHIFQTYGSGAQLLGGGGTATVSYTAGGGGARSVITGVTTSQVGGSISTQIGRI